MITFLTPFLGLKCSLCSILPPECPIMPLPIHAFIKAYIGGAHSAFSVLKNKYNPPFF